MPNQMHDATWKTYGEAWADVPPTERQQLLSQCVAKECAFADPNTELSGVEALTAQIEEFQKLYPGAYFKTSRFLSHHGQSVAQWMMHAKDGSELFPGISVARYGEDGRITHLAGFWTL